MDKALDVKKNYLFIFFLLKNELRVIREGDCEAERIPRAALLGEAGFVPYVSS